MADPTAARDFGGDVSRAVPSMSKSNKNSAFPRMCYHPTGHVRRLEVTFFTSNEEQKISASTAVRLLVSDDGLNFRDLPKSQLAFFNVWNGDSAAADPAFSTHQIVGALPPAHAHASFVSEICVQIELPATAKAKSDDPRDAMVQVSSARLSFCPFAPSSPSPASMYVKRDGTRLQRNGAPFVFFGADVWYAAHLGAADASLGGNRLRLSREFERLRALGARLVRIQAASEGVGTEGMHSVGGSDGARPPALQPQPGVMDEKVALGLDFALHAAAARNLTVLLCLNNFWPWSGGFVQYLRWAGERTTPPPSGKERDAFAQHAALFYTEPRARMLAEHTISYIIGRVNRFTGVAYKDDTTILGWELANGPLAMHSPEAYGRWAAETASFVRRHDRNHLISIGSAGRGARPQVDRVDFTAEHMAKDVDVATIQMWPQDWDWDFGATSDAQLAGAVHNASLYLSNHVKLLQVKQQERPLILSSFCFARRSSSPASQQPDMRDRFFSQLLEQVAAAVKKKNHGSLVGSIVHGWGGEGRARHSDWREGDDFVGDPPFDQQGAYSIFDSDETTLQVLRTHVQTLRAP